MVLIGDTTCGKPYGFYAADNCGTTYFTVQFRGANAKGFGDYADGFSPANVDGVAGIEVPGCVVADDFDHAFADPEESRLHAALSYRREGACPPPMPAARSAIEVKSTSLGAVLKGLNGLKVMTFE